MKFLTDENVYTQIVEAIRSLSHDVLDILSIIRVFHLERQNVCELLAKTYECQLTDTDEARM